MTTARDEDDAIYNALFGAPPQPDRDAQVISTPTPTTQKSDDDLIYERIYGPDAK